MLCLCQDIDVKEEYVVPMSGYRCERRICYAYVRISHVKEEYVVPMSGYRCERRICCAYVRI